MSKPIALPVTALPRDQPEVSVIVDSKGGEIAYIGYDEDAEQIATALNVQGWLEKMHTLHRTVEMLYVVDGYQVTICWDAHPISPAYKADSLIAALDKARLEFDSDARPKWL